MEIPANLAVESAGHLKVVNYCSGGTAAMRTLLLLLLTEFLSTAQSAPPSGLTKLLDAELSRFPARTGVYVKHLTTGEEAGVRADEAFSSASVIKLAIMVRAYQMVDAGELQLNERVEIQRSDLRDGT